MINKTPIYLSLFIALVISTSAQERIQPKVEEWDNLWKVTNEKYLSVKDGIEIEKKLKDGSLKYESLTEEQRYELLKTDGMCPYAKSMYDISWYLCWDCEYLYYPIHSVSSTLKSKDNRFSIKSLHDYYISTAWVEGNENSGKGEWISFKNPNYNPKDTFDKDDSDLYYWGVTVTIFNGYSKSNSLYYQNARVKCFEVYLEDSLLYYLDVIDTPVPQSFNFYVKKNPHLEETFRLKVGDIYKGSKYSDLAISEIFAAQHYCCLSGNTMIYTPKGNIQTMETIKEGDSVLTYNEELKIYEPAIVLGICKTIHNDMIRYSFEHCQLEATADHPILLSDEVWANINSIGINERDKIKTMKVGMKTLYFDLSGKRYCSKIMDIEQIFGEYTTYSITGLSKNSSYIANGLVVSIENSNKYSLSN